MSDTFTIQVVKSSFRLRGSATYKGETYRYSAKSMHDFDEAIIDGAMFDGVSTVVLETGLADGVEDCIQAVADSRAEISSLLEKRQDAIQTAVAKLEENGWSRRDAARVVGVNPNSLQGILSDEDGGVYGTSVLGGEPATVGAGSMIVLGQWERDGEALLRVGDTRVSGLDARVRKLWSAATGYDPHKGDDGEDTAEDDTTESVLADGDDAATASSSDAATVPGTTEGDVPDNKA